MQIVVITMLQQRGAVVAVYINICAFSFTWFAPCSRRKAARKQKAFVEAFPKTPASMAVKSLALKAAKWPLPATASGHLEFFLEQLVQPHIDRGIA